MDGIGYVLGNLRLNKGLTQNIKWFVYILKLTSKDRLVFLLALLVLLEKRRCSKKVGIAFKCDKIREMNKDWLHFQGEG